MQQMKKNTIYNMSKTIWKMITEKIYEQCQQPFENKNHMTNDKNKMKKKQKPYDKFKTHLDKMTKSY